MMCSVCKVSLSVWSGYCDDCLAVKSEICEGYHVSYSLQYPERALEELLRRLSYEVAFSMISKKDVLESRWLIKDKRDPGHDTWMLLLVDMARQLPSLPSWLNIEKARRLRFNDIRKQEEQEEAEDQREAETSWPVVLRRIAEDDGYTAAMHCIHLDTDEGYYHCYKTPEQLPEEYQGSSREEATVIYEEAYEETFMNIWNDPSVWFFDHK